MQENALEKISVNFPVTVTELYVSNNKLTVAPSLKNLDNLQRLDLRYNKITQFPKLGIDLR